MTYVLIVCSLAIVFLIYLGIKNEVTLKQQLRISNAVYEYHTDLINNRRYPEKKVDWSDIEPYDKTLFRLWDWGHKRILPKDKFEIIKPYIK